MDDNDVCPLCCEELDMSDRQFFPCKCGYQVCMWCWHRIRESESGLCPACRTPYGDDPHEFSAVDMEEVVKANKEKAAAEKRERDLLKKQQQCLPCNPMSSTSSVGSSNGSAFSNVGHIQSHSDGLQSDSDLLNASSGMVRQVDPPKDRNQLANMRVIRRNLVYAVGLPPSIATEETLRKPEYFGQYGKIVKIVLNRNHNGNGDPRRASASAYVTFAHKEDTLACILALDGFYVDGRNIRASYGTSKYCSAFIKNVRCNNPDCTYLHGMGVSDDTFTKQEIQAGYVTSGRDVLARQQQQLAAIHQQQNTAAPRRKIGGGGPSGTGKVHLNPVFPSPCYDEPVRPDKKSDGYHSITRSSSSIGSASKTKSIKPKIIPRKGGSVPTAASIVAAGISSTTQSTQAQPLQLTPLVPLKRGNSLPLKEKPKEVVSKRSVTPPTESVDDFLHDTSHVLSEQQQRILLEQQRNAMSQMAKQQSNPGGIIVGGPIGAIGSINNNNNNKYVSDGFIGGSVLLSNTTPSAPSPTQNNDRGVIGGYSLSSGIGAMNNFGSIGSNQLGYDGFGFQCKQPNRDKWNNNSKETFSNNILGGGSLGIANDAGIWANPSSPDTLLTKSETNIKISPSLRHNNTAVGGVLLSKDPFSGESGSSALASMLGIDLPTGSGTLRETASTSSQRFPAPPNRQNPNSLWCTEVSSNNFSTTNNNQGVIGSHPNRSFPNHDAVGGMTIGGHRQDNFNAAPSNNNDIALLQSLLPGVHITSGNVHQPASSNTMWNSNNSTNPIGTQQQRTSNETNNINNADVWGNGLFRDQNSNSRNTQNQEMPSQSIW